MNIYGMVIPYSKPLQWNDELNAVSFIHRKSPTYTMNPPAASTAETGGIIAFVLGGIFLFDSTQTAYSLPLLTILPTAIVLGGTMIGIGYLLLRTRNLKVQTGSEEMLNKKGKVKSLDDSKNGHVHLHGELWKFESQDDLQLNDQVIVIAVDGLTLKVKKLK